MTVNQKFKQFRVSKNISQTELGKRIGVTKETIGNYETDGKPMRSDNLIKIKKLYPDLDFNWLLSESELPLAEFQEAGEFYLTEGNNNSLSKWKELIELRLEIIERKLESFQ